MKRSIIEAVICVALVVALVLFWRHEMAASYERGKNDALLESKQQEIAGLATVIEQTQALVEQAETVSQKIERAISDRQSADQKTTQELHSALSKNATNRVDCRFDVDVMQQLTTARDRANEAAAFGIGYPVSTGTRSD